ncbi:hypothetical protein CpecG_0843 [Chlamydia pecorum MC/MarsBar]|nr:hypothetical protein CpecG_0843 [Chlamydia pecorum MC/MarsBar]ETF37234.1 hypothetical protein CpecF_0842 [Chlamydia pecorum DBDeUG]ETF37641.1 hypothetical protein CpecS_0840 [Chlamydia pecorum VR629]ETF39453.1 hypothetical protein CpecA_0842 [Chlamydia pecorum IPTaLE]
MGNIHALERLQFFFAFLSRSMPTFFCQWFPGRADE